MNRTLPPESLHEIEARLEKVHQASRRRESGGSTTRQPVQVLYGGAHLFRANAVRRLGQLALRSMEKFAPDVATFAAVFGLSDVDALLDSRDAATTMEALGENSVVAVNDKNQSTWLAHTVYRRVREKLGREPIEDIRIDFEDGYGIRPDGEEDGHAVAAARELAQAMNAPPGELPSFVGIRIKPLNQKLRQRSIRTLDIFLTELATITNGELPHNFCITLPKVGLPEEVEALADICSRLESMLGLEPNALHIELMIEKTQALFNERGEANVLSLVYAAHGRCVAVHFGPHDYALSRNIISRQPMTHFASDFAREIMQVTLAGTGVRLSDGPTNIIPVALHREEKGKFLTARQVEENCAAVHNAWKIHFDHVRLSLVNGFYQGWDLHPAQLPARYAAVYSFFLENMGFASRHLRNFIDKAARATRVGQIFDDTATAQGILNYFSLAINCGAITAEEAQVLTGISPAELYTGSFSSIFQSLNPEGNWAEKTESRPPTCRTE